MDAALIRLCDPKRRVTSIGSMSVSLLASPDSYERAESRNLPCPLSQESPNPYRRDPSRIFSARTIQDCQDVKMGCIKDLAG